MCVYDALEIKNLIIINNNPHYSELLINDDALNSLPENGVPPGLMTVETELILSQMTIVLLM
jgi:hypothetical protein